MTDINRNNETNLKEGYQYLVKLKDNEYRLATFNGFHVGMDWSGDTGYPTDCWMHDQVQSFLHVEGLSDVIIRYAN